VTWTSAEFRRSLLAWYDERRRDLPWRAKPGEPADPYGVWLSEIMLQQTTVAAVTGYWRAFVARWPSVEDLARAPLDDVLHAWQGLGYYARARNLHACARHVATTEGGRFPSDEAALRALPGVGAYTAAAIAAIAFNQPALPIDGNGVRVLARLHALETPLPAARAAVLRLASPLATPDRPGDFAQALMDLGATVCTPRRPCCPACPWRGACAGLAGGEPEGFPRAKPQGEKPVRRGIVFWAERADGAILVRKRAPRGLLGGMVEFPSTPWRDGPWSVEEARRHAPAAAAWVEQPGEIRHTFTHFHLRLRVLRARCDPAAAGKARGEAGAPWWCAPDGLKDLALPTLMKKVARLVLASDRAPALALDPVTPSPVHES
jgi:A/G-specific adenine glycosylase